MKLNNTIRDENTNRSNDKAHNIKVAWIGGICVVIAAVIGIININVNVDNKLKDEYDNLKSENLELKTQLDNLQSQYDKLNEQYSNLEKENDILDKENSSLEKELKEYDLLIEENNSMKLKISELQEQLQKEELIELDSNDNSLNKTGNTISIFNLEPFQGESYFFKNANFPFSDETDWLVDMYGTSFHKGYLAFHGEEDHEVNAVYSLKNKYSTCHIMMAWPRGGKDLINSGAYINFYNDGILFYTSPEIKCGDEPIDFYVDISNVDKFSFEFVSTGENAAWMCVTIIYPYFDLIE